MPYFETAQEWLDQSNLLLQARPATTRITTRYSIKPARTRKSKTGDESATDDAAATTETKPPRGSLVIKTYDPESGVVLKYRTTKAAEVSRLFQSSLGRLGRGMAAMPEPPVEEAMPDAPPAGAAAEGASTPTGTAGQQQTGGGGKRKKKGKK
ncbi:signal recognition particle 9 kDa protein-domain-containing protein [Emericellopsis atlantica]|uniref:Signal recognition particle 9 kDa protein-domain-containing protein n=1 Tax=Emericellopsis atlantica TaxID=2614577 RepID=A0A9P7ZN51_9HYPO|nr:signal recognition particle 9 kDa protein-domain-containing protein [Emericellopsis atlantica]KAG9255188.1 signal recognition particle 9 kDa protein-domain-containing protein [Emericellopsis atlantica]